MLGSPDCSKAHTFLVTGLPQSALVRAIANVNAFDLLRGWRLLRSAVEFELTRLAVYLDEAGIVPQDGGDGDRSQNLLCALRNHHRANAEAHPAAEKTGVAPSLVKVMKRFSIAMMLTVMPALPSFAQEQERFSKPPQLPVVSRQQLSDVHCWVETERQNVVNLAELCGRAVPMTPVAWFYTPESRGSSFAGGGSDGGPCDFPGQRARDGSRCGGRAASVRAGGR